MNNFIIFNLPAKLSFAKRRVPRFSKVPERQPRLEVLGDPVRFWLLYLQSLLMVCSNVLFLLLYEPVVGNSILAKCRRLMNLQNKLRNNNKNNTIDLK